jgi:RNA polymerase sigma factor (sigma-70 family)
MESNSKSFERIYSLLYKKVYYFVSFKIKDKDIVEDIVQECFISAFRSWKQIPDIDTARNFLFIIARSRLIDHFRSAHERYTLNSTDLPSSSFEEESIFERYSSQERVPEEWFEESHRKSKVLSILNALPTKDRDIITMRFIQDLSYKDIATILESNQPSVRKKVERAIKNAREYITQNQINL